MRFVTYLACATLVARAEWFEDDDDLQFLRSLQAGNGTNATTTTGSPGNGTTGSPGNGTTTAPPGNGTTTAPSGNGTTTAPTTTAPSGNATTTASSGETTASSGETTGSSGETTGSSGETTGSSGETTGSSGTGSPTTPMLVGGNGTYPILLTPSPAEAESRAAARAALLALMGGGNGTNGTATGSPPDFTASTDITIEATVAAADPFYCALSASTTGDCAPATGGDATTVAAGGNETTAAPARSLQTRKLQSGAVTAAHNIFCAAFAFQGSHSSCAALGDDVLAGVFQAPTKEGGMKNCVTGLTLAFKTGTDNCYQADATGTGEGACFKNLLADLNLDFTDGTLAAPATKSCTKSTGSGLTRDFVTATTVAIPTWSLDSTDGVSVDAAAVTTAAQTAVASPAANEALQGALVVAAVEIATSPATAAVMEAGSGINVTAALGMSPATFEAVKNAIVAGGGAGTFDPSTLADLSSCTSDICTALTAAKAEVASNFVIENKSGTGAGGSTAAAADMMIGSSIVIGLLSLVF